jgi:hypothetical protein
MTLLHAGFARLVINRLRPNAFLCAWFERLPICLNVSPGRGLGRGRDALSLGNSSLAGLPIRLRTASPTLTRPLAFITCLSTANRTCDVVTRFELMASQRRYHPGIKAAVALKSSPLPGGRS